jgi:hypothetical protein
MMRTDASRQHGLLAFAGALCPQDIEHETVLLEDAGLLAKRRDCRVPVAALAQRQHELVLRERGYRGQDDHCESQQTAREHVSLLVVLEQR